MEVVDEVEIVNPESEQIQPQLEFEKDKSSMDDLHSR